MRYSKSNPKLTNRQRLSALWRVARMSYAMAPSVLYLQIVQTIISSVLPIVTTYFAAQTTTELARAYNGEPGASEAVIVYVVLTAAAGVLHLSWMTYEGYLRNITRYKMSAYMDDQLLVRFLSLEFWRYDDKETIDLADRARQFTNVFSYIFSTLSSIISAIVTLVASIVALSLVSGWLSLLLLVAVIPGVIIQYRLSKARSQHWLETIDDRRKAGDIRWQLTRAEGIAELRLYGLAQHLVKLHGRHRDNSEKKELQIERGFIGKELGSRMFESLAEVSALIYVTLQITARAMPIGQFLYVQQLMSRGLSAINMATNDFMTIDQDLVNLSAFDTFMDLPLADGRDRTLKGAVEHIELDHVTFQYPNNDRAVLRDISLSIRKGDRVTIVGQNGSGKSTLIKLILGLYEPTKGEVRIDDIKTDELNLESWHRQLSMLQQFSAEFEFAVAKDNVLYGDVSRPMSPARYKAAIENAEADEFLKELPKADETYISPWMESEDGTKGVALSGGQRQRLALARNFYRDSQVVILDEPTSAIDALAESRIFRRLFTNKTKTLLVVSHRLSTVKSADIIYVLKDGEIAEQGTHKELVANKGEYFTLFESQL